MSSILILSAAGLLEAALYGIWIGMGESSFRQVVLTASPLVLITFAMLILARGTRRESLLLQVIRVEAWVACGFFLLVPLTGYVGWPLTWLSLGCSFTPVCIAINAARRGSSAVTLVLAFIAVSVSVAFFRGDLHLRG